MNPLQWSFRSAYLAGFAICACLVGFALFAQYQLMMDPCPLCILQRVAFIALGLVFLVGSLHAPRGGGRGVYAALVVLTALAGAAIATRHLWIQSLPPDQVPSCGAPLGYMLANRGGQGGLWGVLIKVLSGSGECARVETILGVPMPGWALVWFVFLAGWGGWAARGWRKGLSRA